jgi:hypothetical protein
MRCVSFVLCATAMAAVSLPAYAATGDDIAPAKVDMAAYAPLTCEQLASYSVTLDGAYKDGIVRLDHAEDRRMASMIMGVPISTDKIEAYVADLKGRQAAVQQIQGEKSCMASGAMMAAAPAAPLPAQASVAPAATATPAADAAPAAAPVSQQ